MHTHENQHFLAKDNIIFLAALRRAPCLVTLIDHNYTIQPHELRNRFSNDMIPVKRRCLKQTNLRWSSMTSSWIFLSWDLFIILGPFFYKLYVYPLYPNPKGIITTSRTISGTFKRYFFLTVNFREVIWVGYFSMDFSIHQLSQHQDLVDSWYVMASSYVHPEDGGRTWVFPKIGIPQNGWFIMENPIKTDDWGGSAIFGNTHIFLNEMCLSCPRDQQGASSNSTKPGLQIWNSSGFSDVFLPILLGHVFPLKDTLHGTNISPFKGSWEDDFPNFPR